MSELKELKAGDVVSVWDHVFQEWTAERVVKLHAENEFETVSSFLYSHDYGVLWQHGIHESLIPEGYAIVPIEPTSEMIKPALSWFTGWSHMRAGDRKNAIESAYKAMIEAAQK